MYSKKQLRTQILQIRDALTDAERHSYSEKILQQVLATEQYKTAEILLVFASFRSEVNTFLLIEQALVDGKNVFVPKIEEQMQNDGTREKRMEFYQIFSTDELQEGYWGVPEPEAELERKFSVGDNGKMSTSGQKGEILVILPGAVFDKSGNRIGYGGGFYDRYLSQLERQKDTVQEELPVCKMALAFECQIVESGMIPVDAHDVQVDVIVTEREIYECVM